MPNKPIGRCPGNGNRDTCVHLCERRCAVTGDGLASDDGWPLSMIERLHELDRKRAAESKKK